MNWADEHPISAFVWTGILTAALVIFAVYTPSTFRIHDWWGDSNPIDITGIKALAFVAGMIVGVVTLYLIAKDIRSEVVSTLKDLTEIKSTDGEILLARALSGQDPAMYSYLKDRQYRFVIAADGNGGSTVGISLIKDLVPYDFAVEDFFKYHNANDPLELKPIGHKDYQFNRPWSKADSTPRYVYAEEITAFCCAPLLPGFRAWAYPSKGNKAAHWYTPEDKLKALEWFRIDYDLKESE